MTKTRELESPIQSTLIVDQLYNDIKNRILRGELSPNTKLSVRVLCEHYKVSDTPLKQALNRLVSEQLVVANPRRGMSVKSFTLEEIDEAMQVRAMIELYAVEAAIKKAESDPEFISGLEQNIKEDEALVSKIKNMNVYSADTQKELEVSRNFHVIFIGALGNQTILNMYNNIQNHRYLYYQLGIDKEEQTHNSIAEHKAILEALKTGDENSLKQAIKAHIIARKRVVSAHRN